ncbi:hypothetical protein [Planctobacterium marinum]|uniref:hypothetical protein n=1 Tax=Planctobacterium marinum TaxID=1631968 RepID=UPI001E44547B|nr:hypothetical protein [Planctobacterium marinum]MCC2604100.1 hypothetical protein [Planctobacterium marinum]
MQLFVTGFEHSKGTGKSNGKPYEIATLYCCTPLRPWKTENGEKRVAGFHADEKQSGFKVKADPKLIEEFLGNAHPAHMDVQLEPDPENPMKNMVVGAEPVRQHQAPKKDA